MLCNISLLHYSDTKQFIKSTAISLKQGLWNLHELLNIYLGTIFGYVSKISVKCGVSPWIRLIPNTIIKQANNIMQSCNAWKHERCRPWSSQTQTSYLSFNKSRQRQVVKQVGEILPHIGIAVLAQTLIVESINLCNLSTLVVTTKDCDTILEPHLGHAWLLILRFCK